jgi:hypothetical protein
MATRTFCDYPGCQRVLNDNHDNHEFGKTRVSINQPDFRDPQPLHYVYCREHGRQVLDAMRGNPMPARRV